MTVRDLKEVYYYRVRLYIKDDETDEGFTDLYKGKIDDVPENLLDKKIMALGGTRCAEMLKIKIEE